MKVWIGEQEAPAEAFALSLSGHDATRLERDRPARKLWGKLALQEPHHESRLLKSGERVGTILSTDGHLLYRSSGTELLLEARAFTPAGATRMIRGLEAVVLRLQPKSVLLGHPDTSDEGEAARPSAYPAEGALFVRMIHTRESALQRIEVGEHPVYGRMLFLNGETQIASSDEDLYSRSLVQPALRKKPRRVLILGGGDCGVLRQVLTHAVEEVVMVEIDPEVIETAAEFFPEVVGRSREDPRTRIVIGDAFPFLAENQGRFDLIIYDLSDTPLEPVGGVDIFERIHGALAPKGRVAVQCGSGLEVYRSRLRRSLAALQRRFRKVRTERVVIPSFLEQPWVFAFARKAPTP